MALGGTGAGGNVVGVSVAAGGTLNTVGNEAGVFIPEI